MKHVIVTGGTGVTGTALVRYLLSEEIYVTALIRKGSKRKRYLPLGEPKLTVLEYGMEQYEILDRDVLTEEYDVFFHLAWEGSTGKEKTDNRNNMKLQNSNVARAVEAVELCRRLHCPVFLETGSQAEYGRVEGLIDETTDQKPENGYGAAKVCARRMTSILCGIYGIRHIWAQLFSIYGPFDGTHSMIYTGILKLLCNERQKYTKGEQIWDYLYSFDAAKALKLLAEHGESGEIYCVANGKQARIRDYIEIMHRIVNPAIVPVFGELPYAKQQVMSMCPDITKLKNATGFTPQYSFEQGIQEIYKWSLQEKEALAEHLSEFVQGEE